jgi:hypothetical protein
MCVYKALLQNLCNSDYCLSIDYLVNTTTGTHRLENKEEQHGGSIISPNRLSCSYSIG